MQLDCEVLQCFAMSGAYEACKASINLVNEQILLLSKPNFGHSKDLQKYMGKEHFEIHISHNNEMQIFKVKKTSAEKGFKITKDDMNKFKNFKSAILFHDKLNTDLDYKNIKKNVLKI